MTFYTKGFVPVSSARYEFLPEATISYKECHVYPTMEGGVEIKAN